MRVCGFQAIKLDTLGVSHGLALSYERRSEMPLQASLGVANKELEKWKNAFTPDLVPSGTAAGINLLI